MKRSFCIIAVLSLVCSGTAMHEATAQDHWQAPFDTSGAGAAMNDSVLTLGRVLGLVAAHNPALRSFKFQGEASRGRLKQAGLWSNPELEVELEEAGLDAPGFTESEISVSLSQEFELFGQRGARKRLARAGMMATALHIKLSTYDLYLETKRRFYDLAHAQKKLELAGSSVALARDIVDDITLRIQKGAALESELLLARLELQRGELAVSESIRDRESARARLASLWSEESITATVTALDEPDFAAILNRLPAVYQLADSSRSVMQLERAADLARAEKQSAAAEARPSIFLRSGYRRLAVDGSNSLLFGVSLPLPVFNRNQGTTASFEAQLRSLRFERHWARTEAEANIRAGLIRLQRLIEQHATLDTLLVPTAEEAYRVLHKVYATGRIAYTNLLEAERSLIDLRFEHNDILLSIHEQIIALERITGAAIYTPGD